MGSEQLFSTEGLELDPLAVTDDIDAPQGARKHKIMLVFGTRPEAIKMAPVILGLRERDDFDVVTVVTGQHREMLDQVLGHFAIKPDFDLEIMEAGQSLTGVTVKTLERLAPLLESEIPDAVVVQGDTTAAMAGALAAFYHRIPVVHLEAGLRSGDISSPFPEELNRRLVSQLAVLHLAPTHEASDNLVAENVNREAVVVTGNTVIDALLWSVAHPSPYEDPALHDLDSDPRRVILVTAHRRESWGEPMHAIGLALAAIAKSEPDVVIVIPVHRNPVVREALLPALVGLDNVVICEPLGYGEFVHLISRADLIVTDSGGLQEEGPTIGKPVLVMRDTTERPEAVAAGGVRLVGTHTQTIVENIRGLLHDGEQYAAMAIPRDVYGDGRAAARSISAISHLLGSGLPATEFVPGVKELLPV